MTFQPPLQKRVCCDDSESDTPGHPETASSKSENETEMDRTNSHSLDPEMDSQKDDRNERSAVEAPV